MSTSPFREEEGWRVYGGEVGNQSEMQAAVQAFAESDQFTMHPAYPPFVVADEERGVIRVRIVAKPR